MTAFLIIPALIILLMLAEAAARQQSHGFTDGLENSRDHYGSSVDVYESFFEDGL